MRVTANWRTGDKLKRRERRAKWREAGADRDEWQKQRLAGSRTPFRALKEWARAVEAEEDPGVLRHRGHKWG